MDSYTQTHKKKKLTVISSGQTLDESSTIQSGDTSREVLRVSELIRKLFDC